MSFLHITIKTFKGEVTLKVKTTIKSRKLFNLVCERIGIIEKWYFSILMETNSGFSWLSKNKPLIKQVKIKEQMTLFFMVKFYPNSFKDVCLMSTRYLFFLQLKRTIMSENIFCPAEVAVLLASYALRIENTSLNVEEIKVTDLIPNSVICSYNIDLNTWANILLVWFTKLCCLNQEEAIAGYLEICQDLPMYGVNYFAVKIENGGDLWLGVTASGIKLYEKQDFLNANVSYEWHDISKVYMNRKTLTIKFTKVKKELKLFVETKIIKELFNFLIENNKFHLKKKELKIWEFKNPNDRMKGVIKLPHDNCNDIISWYQSILNSIQNNYTEKDKVIKLLSEKCNLAEEESIILSSIITAQCLKHSRHILEHLQDKYDFRVK